jgi:hypothetical protein
MQKRFQHAPVQPKVQPNGGNLDFLRNQSQRKKENERLTTSAGWSWGTRFYWENLATSWRRKPIVISAIPRRPHQRTNHESQKGRPEALMRCAKNLINNITPPMNDKINPQIFSVLGVNMHIGTTLTIIRAENPAFNYGFSRPKQLIGNS